MPTRILIADDHALMRSGLRRILADEFPLAEIEETGDAEGLLDAARRKPWDMVTLDIGLPGRSGLDVLGELKRSCPGTAVLIVSMYAEEQFAARAFKAGASGFITKANAPDELIAAARKVLSGGRYVSAALAEKMADSLARGGAGALPHELLSPRELEVLLAIASGKSASEIAGALSLSVKTVSTYRARILEKMGLQSNADLIRYVIQHGLAP